MAVSSYNAIGSVTLSSAQAQVTFSNISQIYTDLVLVIQGSSSGDSNLTIQVNGDTATNYGTTRLLGDGSTVASDRVTSGAAAYCGMMGTVNPTPTIIQFQNYSNSTTYKSILSRLQTDTTTTDYLGATASTWRSTSAINSIKCYLVAGTNFGIGTTFNLYGIGANQLKASGGDIIVSDGTYWYHAFKTSGTFTPNSTLSCDVLVVGGGGGGGAQVGGGGGAGGVFYATTQSINAAQTVIIGSGGIGGSVSVSQGSNGTNSTFGSLTAALGGGGGGSMLTAPLNNGLSGGSGGGGGANNSVNGTGGSSTQAGTGGTGYGFAGGNGNQPAGAGGGGASAAGGNAGGGQGGNGGNGLTTWSQWLSTTSLGKDGSIAGGGSGGSNTTMTVPGGNGGGGNGGGGSTLPPGAGMQNTGGGGGGTRDKPDSGEAGGRGGSGLVIVRYAV